MSRSSTPRLGFTSAVLLLTAFSGPLSGVAVAAGCDVTTSSTCVTSSGGEFDTRGVTRTVGIAEPAARTASNGRPGSPRRTLVTDSAYAPTCSGNGPDKANASCGAATTTCPKPGDIRLWRYTRQVRNGVPVTPWQLVTSPPYVCLGPTNPVVRPKVAIPALVTREFKRLVVLRGVTAVEPAPQTLVNLETTFSTDAPRSYPIETTILGQQVHITAKAESYRWHFGDGATATTSGPGAAGSAQVAHTYTRPGRLAAYVVISWSGRFTVGTDPTVLPVDGTATTSGPPAPLGVREARSQYESGGR